MINILLIIDHFCGNQSMEDVLSLSLHAYKTLVSYFHLITMNERTNEHHNHTGGRISRFCVFIFNGKASNL